MKKIAKKTTGFYVEEILLKQLGEIAVKRRQSISAIINELIEKEVSNDKKRKN